MSDAAGTPYFYGRSDHRLNTKGQVAIPARFRSVLTAEALERGFVLLQGEAPCIYCYTHDQFREIVDRVMGEEETRGDADFLREFFEQVFAVDVDSQGRIVLPAQLREEVGISGKEVCFIGHNDRIEIWDAGVRGQERKRTREEYEAKRGRLARRIFGA